MVHDLVPIKFRMQSCTNIPTIFFQYRVPNINILFYIWYLVHDLVDLVHQNLKLKSNDCVPISRPLSKIVYQDIFLYLIHGLEPNNTLKKKYKIDDITRKQRS